MEPLVGREQAFVPSLVVDGVEVAFERRPLGRGVVDRAVVGSDDAGHLPAPFGERPQRFAGLAEVEVHPARRRLLHNEEAASAVDPAERTVGFVGHIAGRTLAVDRLLLRLRRRERVGRQPAEDDLLLTAVAGLVPQLPARRPADAGNVLRGVGAGVDLRRTARFEVEDVERHHRIGVARLGVFEVVGAVVERAVVAHHLEERHARLVETQVGDAPRVGRDGEGAREAELLLVDPVGRAVDRLVPAAVAGDLPRALPFDIVDIQVVAARKDDVAAVGREDGVARGGDAEQNLAQAPAVVVEVVRGERVAIDRFGAVGHEHSAVRSDRIVGYVEPAAAGVAPRAGGAVERIEGHGALLRGCGQQGRARVVDGIAVAEDVAVADRGVVFAVGRGADARQLCRTEASVGDVVVVERLCSGRRAGQQRKEKGR